MIRVFDQGQNFTAKAELACAQNGCGIAFVSAVDDQRACAIEMCLLENSAVEITVNHRVSLLE